MKKILIKRVSNHQYIDNAPENQKTVKTTSFKSKKNIVTKNINLVNLIRSSLYV